MSKLPKEAIEQARDDIVAVIERYGIKLEKRGKELFGLCPFHNESSPSFTVTPAKGRYHCFGCGANGDPIQFVQDYAGVGFREAVQIITGGEPDPDFVPRAKRTIERDEVEDWVPMPTVPEKTLRPMDVVNRKINGVWHKLVAVRHWTYLDADGKTIGYIYRFPLPPKADGSPGGKEVVPQTYCVNQKTGEVAWRWLSFSKPRPLYGLDKLAAYPKAQVLIVEGEKDCDGAQALFLAAGVPLAKLIVISWPGGGKAIKHVDWSPLFGRTIALWPDADQKDYPDIHPLAGTRMPFAEQPGTTTMRDIHAAIRAECPPIKFVAPPAGVPDGWGLGDPLPEDFILLKHMKAGASLADEVFAQQPAPQPEPQVDDIPPWIDEMDAPSTEPIAVATPAPKPTAKPEHKPTKKETKADDFDAMESNELSKNGYFSVLGYDRERYYIMQYEKCQIMVYTKGDFSEAGLIELAPTDWWELHFADKGKIDKKMAMNWIVRKAHSRGIYDTSRLRGRGAWTDAGRHVFHHGGFLTVDSEHVEIADFDSRYVYEMSRSLPDIDDTPLTDEEGQDLLTHAEVFRWAKPASAALMAGWIALAPICGAIKWRPHIWLSGGAGSGKTTVLNEFVHALLNGMDLYAQGNSTEAGIRQELKGDAIPVLFDESESNSERESLRIQSVLSLIRQASSESQAKTLKGSASGDAMSFHIRSMFCLASIQVGIKYQADIERMTVLSLLPKRDDPNAADTWKRISEILHALRRDETLPGRLVRRSMNLLPITLQNIKTFSEAGAIRFGSQRDGDQYGTLLAGAWSLISSEPVTLESALGLIDDYDWSEHRENNEVDEGERALSALMGALVRIHGGAEVTVNELVRRASGIEVEGLTMATESAEAVLQRHGMRTDNKLLILSNTSMQLKQLMAGTPFEADLRGVLLRVKGAQRYPTTIKFNGIASRAITLPLTPLLTDDILSETGEVSF